MPKVSILNSVERKFILLIGDTLIVLASLNLFINHAIDKQYVSSNLKVSVVTFGILTFFALSYILDFYNLEKVSRRRYVLSQSVYITVFFVFWVFLFTVFVYDVSYWRIPLLSFLLLTPIEVGLWRLFFSNVFKIIPTTKNVLYVYDENAMDNLKEHLEYINGDGKNTFYRVKLTYCIDNKASFLKKRTFLKAIDKIDSWILNLRNYDDLPKDLEVLMLDSILNKKEVISYSSFYENVYEAMPIKSHHHSFYELLQLRNRKIRYLQVIFSYLVNFILSFLVGLLFVIVFPFVWFLNLFFNRGPILYSQLRVGQYGKEFKIYKFRSMVVDAERSGAKMATKNDARITPFGKVLRVFRIDELPQIISVIRGEMTFIGPRPERKVFVDQLNDKLPFYGIRHLFKPGITGWAQVKYKYGEDLEDSIRKLEYDLYYIKNRSITLDLRIIFKTVTTVLFSRGV
ncbi:sugar transferase [Flagellimonas aequoris]|uniref:Exopolysaccharide biosynthesis protein n=1 Tax=Flagellimonas aequoris TaxID=2306997 RepID=A0A418NAR1_9FLAO|nr:sugar transferase [Allomuricauda aequoris]RIV72552.1 exopolysaccharide biosynthesis protein [Allomuricauda aequoris]TXK05053.1 exopolysaccharide biosynthesis protein [Allomuricauda aequoris]